MPPQDEFDDLLLTLSQSVDAAITRDNCSASGEPMMTFTVSAAPGSVRTLRSVESDTEHRALVQPSQGSERHRVDWQRKFTVDIAASVLIVLFHALGLGSGAVEDSRARKRAKVDTTHRRLWCCTYALVRAGFSR
jgi:hypothetical protein